MRQKLKIALQMDPLEKINPKEDSTFVIAQEAQRRGYKLFHYSPKDISLKNKTIIAKGCYFKIINQGKKFFSEIVKNIFKELTSSCVCNPKIPVCNCDIVQDFKYGKNKKLFPSANEIKQNSRSSSAILRYVVKQ